MFGSFVARYSSDAALRGNNRNISHQQTPLLYDQNNVENDVKHHSLTQSQQRRASQAKREQAHYQKRSLTDVS